MMRRFIRFISKWAWRQELETINGIVRINELSVVPGKMAMHIEQNPAIARWVAQCFASLLLGSPNYTELKFRTRKPDTFDWIVVTVRRDSGQTPHELRIKAECERDKLLAELKKRGITDVQ
jgi:hypothetical protein